MCGEQPDFSPAQALVPQGKPSPTLPPREAHSGLCRELRVTAQAACLVHAVPVAPSFTRGLCALPLEPG